VSIAVTNGAPGALTGLVATSRYTAGQPVGWLTATLNAQTTPATLTVGVTAGPLPAGLYTANIDISSMSPGVVNSPLTLPVSFRVAAPVAGSITGSSLLSGTIASQGQVNVYNYTATANARVTLSLVQTSGFTTSGFTPNPRATLVTPSGAALSVVTASDAAGSSAAIDLPETGTYLLRVQSANLTGIGTYNVGIAELQPPNPIGQLACGGVLTGRIAALGQIDGHTFTATAGSQVLLSLAEATSFGNAGFTPQARMSLYSPSGVTLATATTGGTNSGASVTATLPENGTYLVSVWSANFLGAGTYNLGRTCLN
jgi:hypothetical protein